MSDRDLATVIEEVIKLVPKAEEQKRLISGLESILESAKYSAPEMINTWWNEFGNYLNINMPTISPTNTKWQKDIYELVTMQKFPEFPEE